MENRKKSSSLRISLTSSLIVIATVLSATVPSRAEEMSSRISAEGVVARKDMIILFAQVTPAGAATEPVLPSAQIFISTNNGKSWERRGPSMRGCKFEYIADSPRGIWIAGLHVVEGPGIDPFCFVPAKGGRIDWAVHTIMEEPADILSVAFDKDGNLLAWIRHIDPLSENFTGPIFLHKSADDGVSWRAVGKVKTVPKSDSKLKLFRTIPTQDGDWRIAAARRSSIGLEHWDSKSHRWNDLLEFKVKR